MKNEPNSVTAETAQGLVASGQAVLVDIRSCGEFSRAHIPGSFCAPADSLLPGASVLGEFRQGQTLIFLCKSGMRTRMQQSKLLACAGARPCTVLQGGIDAWSAAGLPLETGERQPPLDIMRQVMVIAGALVLLGVLAGALLSPWWLILAGFVGAGLAFAGITGFCAMALLLQAMPWNRTGASLPGSGSCCGAGDADQP